LRPGCCATAVCAERLMTVAAASRVGSLGIARLLMRDQAIAM
jgi:hypothetical protein